MLDIESIRKKSYAQEMIEKEIERSRTPGSMSTHSGKVQLEISQVKHVLKERGALLAKVEELESHLSAAPKESAIWAEAARMVEALIECDCEAGKDTVVCVAENEALKVAASMLWSKCAAVENAE